jgi:hypothetical protein
MLSGHPWLAVSESGVITGTPPLSSSGDSALIYVEVQDSGSPPDSATATCSIPVKSVQAALLPCWMMDIADAAGNRLVSSIPLVTGQFPAANILAPWDYLGVGSAFIIKQSGMGPASDIPDDTNLGSQFLLLFDSNEGYPSNPVIVPLSNAPNQTLTVSLPINGGSLTLKLRLYYNEGN